MKNSPFTVSLLGIAFAASALAADWPQWRGPDRNDHSPDKSILAPWPAGGPKQNWVFKEAGLGYSGFSIVAGRLYTMGAMDDGEPRNVVLSETLQRYREQRRAANG